MLTCRRTQSSFQGGHGRIGEVGNRAQSQSRELLFGALPHTPQLSDGQWVQELDDLSRRDDEHAVGLGPCGREFGHELGCRYTDRTGDLLFIMNARTNEFANGGWRTKSAQRPRNIEEGFVETERLDQRRDGAEQCHHIATDLGVHAMVGFEDDRMGGDTSRS